METTGKSLRKFVFREARLREASVPKVPASLGEPFCGVPGHHDVFAEVFVSVTDASIREGDFGAVHFQMASMVTSIRTSRMDVRT